MVLEAPGSGARDFLKGALPGSSNSLSLPVHRITFSPWVEKHVNGDRLLECEMVRKHKSAGC